MAFVKKGPSTGFYGVEGGIAPVFSCGSSPLAPSLLTGDASHMSLWIAFVIHVAALGLNVAANVVFMSKDSNKDLDLYWAWSLFSMIGHASAVVGVLVYTGFVKDALSMPNVLTLLIGLLFGAAMATSKISFAHSGLAADAAENLLYNLSIVFQAIGLASVVANGLVAASKSGGI